MGVYWHVAGLLMGRQVTVVAACNSHGVTNYDYLGTGSCEESDLLLPVKIGSRNVTYIASCSDSSFAVTGILILFSKLIMLADALSCLDEGEVYAWGNNEYRQLAVKSDVPKLSLPEAMDCTAMDGGVAAIAPGGGFTAFLTCMAACLSLACMANVVC
jgi:hypothetical protein